MDVVIQQASGIRGELRLPADKAISHRAALLCALTEGQTDIVSWPTGDDCQRTLGVLERLGVAIDRSPTEIRIHGVGLTGLRAPQGELDCGESGTTIRLTAGLLAGQPFESRLTAGPSLSQRPMRRIIEPLSQMGARISSEASMPSFEGSPPEAYPPLTISECLGPIRGISHTMPIASAQVKSAILLAGLYADGPTTVIEPSHTRDHTERLLQLLGVSVHQAEGAVTIQPPHRELATPGRLAVPGDFSSAAFFIVAAAVLPGSSLAIHDVGLNPTRIYLLEVLRRMGASIEWTVCDEAWEPRGEVRVTYRQPLHGVIVEAEEAPRLIDELPILMVAACTAQRETRFKGVGELRVKETDRVKSMTSGLRKLGARVLWSDPDLLIAGPLLTGDVVESFNDHRTAMSLAVAGLVAAGQTTIRGAECVGKSFGEFFDVVARVRRD